jgi:hypothetical protein
MNVARRSVTDATGRLNLSRCGRSAVVSLSSSPCSRGKSALRSSFCCRAVRTPDTLARGSDTVNRAPRLMIGLRNQRRYRSSQ